MYGKVLESHGINNWNKKVGQLLGLFFTKNLKVINSFFTKSTYTTWQSFSNLQSPRMLDIIAISSSLFKCANNCEVLPLGMRSDPLAGVITLLNRTIKFKIRNKERSIIDWIIIKKDVELNKKLNLSLYEKLKGQ